MSNNSEDPKNKLTLEQLKQLMAMQQGQQQLTKGQARKQKLVQGIFQTIQKLTISLDSFIKFITQKHETGRNDVMQFARSPIIFGIYVILIFVIFGGIWTTFAPLNSAAIATGTVIASSNKKIIQHQEGGIIKDIFVKQGDIVKKGDKLIELEETITKAKYENTLNEYRNLLANEARLLAERDHLEKIDFPEFLLKDVETNEVEKIINTQENLFRSNMSLYKAKKESTKQKIEQYTKEHESLKARRIATLKNSEIAKDRLKALKDLFAKGFVQKAAMLEQEAKTANAESDVAAIESKIAQTAQEIARTEIEFLSLQNEFTSKILSELKDNQAKLTQAKEQYFAITDALKRIIITSPVDGIINSLKYHTIGGVIGQGAAIMEISPSEDKLIIEAKVEHKNISVVHPGLVAKIRFSAFKSRTTPLFTGTVTSVSPDIIQDDRAAPGQQPYYMARIEIDMEEFQRITKDKNLKLYQGMGAEVQIITGTKTLLRYLLDPLTDVMFKSFREK